ncbi:hypothetical protein PFISCL1PPCAC_5476, partial [Pristionchus fissidentatus]
FAAAAPHEHFKTIRSVVMSVSGGAAQRLWQKYANHVSDNPDGAHVLLRDTVDGRLSMGEFESACSKLPLLPSIALDRLGFTQDQWEELLSTHLLTERDLLLLKKEHAKGRLVPSSAFDTLKRLSKRISDTESIVSINIQYSVYTLSDNGLELFRSDLKNGKINNCVILFSTEQVFTMRYFQYYSADSFPMIVTLKNGAQLKFNAVAISNQSYAQNGQEICGTSKAGKISVTKLRQKFPNGVIDGMGRVTCPLKKAMADGF